MVLISSGLLWMSWRPTRFVSISSLGSWAARCLFPSLPAATRCPVHQSRCAAATAPWQAELRPGFQVKVLSCKLAHGGCSVKKNRTFVPSLTLPLSYPNDDPIYPWPHLPLWFASCTENRGTLYALSSNIHLLLRKEKRKPASDWWLSHVITPLTKLIQLVQLISSFSFCSLFWQHPTSSN